MAVVASMSPRGFSFSAMLARQALRWRQQLGRLQRCQTFLTFAPKFERLRPEAVPLRSRKSAKSSEDKQGRHFIDYCQVKVKVCSWKGNTNCGLFEVSGRNWPSSNDPRLSKLAKSTVVHWLIDVICVPPFFIDSNTGIVPVLVWQLITFLELEIAHSNLSLGGCLSFVTNPKN